MIMMMRWGKQNQLDKVEYMDCIRKRRPGPLPPVRPGLLLLQSLGKDSAQGFPSFRQLEDYYSLFVFPGSTRVSLSRTMFQGVGIYSKEKTHSARKQSVRRIELNGVQETQIRQAKVAPPDM